MSLSGNSLYESLRRAALIVSSTPLHPQWFSFKAKARAAASVADGASGDLLDIGCADGGLRRHLAGRCRYVGLDSTATGSKLYGARPEVFGDAAQLPFRANSFDAVVLLDVLEHLAEPRTSLQEICRVLRPGGLLYINVPCIYPLHDEPFDFQRPTVYGLRHWLQAAGLEVATIEPRGTPAETAALLLNIVLVRFVTRATRAFVPAALLILLAAPMIPIVNLVGCLVGRLERSDRFMPFAYWAVASRPIESTARQSS